MFFPRSCRRPPNWTDHRTAHPYYAVLTEPVDAVGLGSASNVMSWMIERRA